jgi:hypothetical protein
VYTVGCSTNRFAVVAQARPPSRDATKSPEVPHAPRSEQREREDADQHMHDQHALGCGERDPVGNDRKPGTAREQERERAQYEPV